MNIQTIFKKLRAEELAQVLRGTFARFPLSFLCALAGTVLFLCEHHDITAFDKEFLARAILFMFNGSFLFTAAALFAENSRLTPRNMLILMAGCVALLAGVSWLPDHFTVSHALFAGSLALSLLFAPYILKPATEDSVWYFNYRNGMALAVTGVSSLILALGVSAILKSLEYLFGLDIGHKIYADVWIVTWFFFSPICFLSQIPGRFDFEKKDCAVPGGISFIANYLLVPLVLIYMFILYAYLLKIAVKWELPRGNLAWIVTGFGVAGIVTHLCVHALRDAGTRLLKEFHRYFYLIMLVPILLLAIGIWTRVSQYGVTEDRYMVLLCLIWFSGLSAIYIVKPKAAHIRRVPMTLALLFLLGSFGPWGIGTLPANSQITRLEPLLVKTGVLVDGKAQKTTQEVSFDDRKDISSIVDYIYSHDKQSKIADWVLPFKDEAAKESAQRCGKRGFKNRCYTYGEAQKVVEAWGIGYVGPGERKDEQGLHFNAPQSDRLSKISGYAYIADIQAWLYTGDWSAEKTYSEDGAPFKISFKFTKAGIFSVRLADGRGVSFDLKTLAPEIKRRGKGPRELKSDRDNRLYMNAESNGLKVELRISSLNGYIVNDNPDIRSAGLQVLIAP